MYNILLLILVLSLNISGVQAKEIDLIDDTLKTSKTQTENFPFIKKTKIKKAKTFFQQYKQDIIVTGILITMATIACVLVKSNNVENSTPENDGANIIDLDSPPQGSNIDDID